MGIQVALRENFLNANRTHADFVSVVLAERPDFAGLPYRMTSGIFGHVMLRRNKVSKGTEYPHIAPWIEQEHLTLRHAEDPALPIPRVLRVSQLAHMFDMTRIAGDDLRLDDMKKMKLPALRALAGGVSRCALGFGEKFSARDAMRLINNPYGITLAPDNLVAALKTRSAERIFGGLTSVFTRAMEEHRDRAGAFENVVIHGDLKPSNIKVKKREIFSGLIDFGGVDYTTPAGLFAIIFMDAAARTPVFCEAYSAAGGQKIEARDAGLYALALDLSRRLTLFSDDLQYHEREAVATLKKLDRYAPAKIVAAVP